MHTGRVYPLDQNMRVYCGNFTYPLWFPRDGYSGSITTYRSTDWSAPITWLGPFVLTGWSPGDRTFEYSAADVILDGHTVHCSYNWTLNASGSRLTGSLDLFVDGVKQIKSTTSLFPVPVLTPQHYFDSMQIATPSTPFKCQVSACALAAIGY